MPYSIFVGGPPGTGKSWFAGSVADVVGPERVLVLATKPREADSFAYVSRQLTVEKFYDPLWRPSIGKFEATGFLRLNQRLFELMEDDQYDAVIVDPFTDAGELASHEILKMERAATPKDTRDSRGYYGSLKSKQIELVKNMVYLKGSIRPKYVIVTCHLAPLKEENEDGKKSADKRAQGIVFEGQVVPAIEGGSKLTMAGEFDIQIYTDAVTRNKIVSGKAVTETDYVIQVKPDGEKFAKLAVVPALADATLPNNMKALLAAIEKASAVKVA